MKTHMSQLTILLTLSVALSAAASAQQTPVSKPAAAPSTAHQKVADKTTSPVVLDSQKAKASYAIGVSIARTLQQRGLEVDSAILFKGMKDALAGGKLLVTEEEAQAAIAALQKEAHDKHEAEAKALAEKNRKEGTEFLAVNKAKEGVIALPSGLQYKVITQGDGAKPTVSDTVVCNYRGTLINGKEFDSSYTRKKPATVAVGGVIKGWTEILQLMPVGSKYQVFIPSELAYGPTGNPVIGGDATLIFDIELMSIKEKSAATAMPPNHPAIPAPAATAPATAKSPEPAK
jgi:FKBP-type peptidyl-prolyl cis-trans isomerase